MALAVLAALWKWSGVSDLTIFSLLFGFIVTGHHLPGWFRAFGEPVIYERYKARLWTSVFAIPFMVIVPTALGLGAVALTVAAVFDLWHVAMQQHGFGRIYSAKQGDTSAESAKLDLACVLVWYGTVVAWSDSWMQGIARTFRRAGLPVFLFVQPSGWRAVQIFLAAASAALLGAYAIRAARLWRETGLAAPQKHFLHALAFAVLVWSYQNPSWYRAQSVQNLFHALQYFFMVWIYGHLSIRREPTRPTSFYRALFRRQSGLLLFAGLIALYGIGALALSASGYRLTGVDAERQAQVIGSIGLASLLLHFYVDSFIWKVRSREVRRTLAIRETEKRPDDNVQPIREPVWRGISHACVYFGLPLALAVLLGAKSWTYTPAHEREALAHEAVLFPRSAMAHHAYGTASLQGGEIATARRELETTLRLSPMLEGPAAALAELDHREGNLEAEIEHGRMAVRASPRDAAIHYALANALARQRQFAEAEKHYRETIRLRPNFAGAEQNLGVLYKWQEQLDLAIPHFRRAYALDPDFADAARSLAGALATLGQTEEALATLARYRERHPEDRVAAELEQAIRADAPSRSERRR